MPQPRRGQRALVDIHPPRRTAFRGLGDDASNPLNYLPVGTQLVYNATYSPTFLLRDVQQVTAQLRQALTQIGIAVIGAQGTGPRIFAAGGLTLTLLLKQAYTTSEMVRQAVDGQLSRFSDGVLTSNISVTQVPVETQQPTTFPTGATVSQTAAPGYQTTPAAGPGAGAAAEAAAQGKTAPGPSAIDWLTNNWPWLAIGGVGAIILVKEL